MYGLSGYGTNAYAAPRIEAITAVSAAVSIGIFVVYMLYGLQRSLNDTPKTATLYLKGRSATLSAKRQ